MIYLHGFDIKYCPLFMFNESCMHANMSYLIPWAHAWWWSRHGHGPLEDVDDASLALWMMLHSLWRKFYLMMDVRHFMLAWHTFGYTLPPLRPWMPPFLARTLHIWDDMVSYACYGVLSGTHWARWGTFWWWYMTVRWGDILLLTIRCIGWGETCILEMMPLFEACTVICLSFWRAFFIFYYCIFIFEANLGVNLMTCPTYNMHFMFLGILVIVEGKFGYHSINRKVLLHTTQWTLERHHFSWITCLFL